LKGTARAALAALVLVAGAALQTGVATAAEPTQALQAPNVVVVSPRLVTSGQPTGAALRGLRAQGFDAVVYLAPSNVQDAVRDEPAIVREQRLEFVHVPIDFERPGSADVRRALAALAALRERRVLVHCQVNFRASSVVFLYRVLVEHERPEAAYEAVARVWSPNRAWRALIVQELRDAGIAFEPY
jgi:protein tyrosine phosphatase (PTP) superfamily phosphohydrolase (DUF442 family)